MKQKTGWVESFPMSSYETFASCTVLNLWAGTCGCVNHISTMCLPGQITQVQYLYSLTKLLWLKTELSLEKRAACSAIELVTFLLNPTVVSDNTTFGNY